MNETTYVRLPSGKTKPIHQINIGDEIVIIDPSSLCTMSYTVSTIRYCKSYLINGITVGDHILTPNGLIPTSSIRKGDVIYHIPYVPPIAPIPIRVDPYCLGVCIYRNMNPDTSLKVIPQTLRNVYVKDAFTFIGHAYIPMARYFTSYYPMMIEGKISRDIVNAPIEDLLCFTRGLLDVIATYDAESETHVIQTDDEELIEILEIICARTLRTCYAQQVDVDIPTLHSTYSYWIVHIRKGKMETTVETIINPTDHEDETQWGIDIGEGHIVCTATGIPLQYKLSK